MSAHDRPGITGVEFPAGTRPRRMTIVTIADRGNNEARRTAYRVRVVFRHPVQAAGFDDDGVRTPIFEGDSGLRIPAGDIRVALEEPEVEGGELRIALLPNDEGNLAQAVAELVVDGSIAARRVVTTHLGAILARLTFETDAPIAVHLVEVTAIDTNQAATSLLYRGEDVELTKWPEWAHHAPAFFRNAYAVYREGVNSTNAYWALLCFVRVAEGALVFRARAVDLMKQRGMDLTRPPLVLEDDPLIVPPWRESIGKRAGAVVDRLKHDLRVPAAHGVSPAGPMQAADQLGVENRYWLGRPVAQQIARSLLRESLELREVLGVESVPELDAITFA